MRGLPNILIVGTPGTGKSTIAKGLNRRLKRFFAPHDSPFRHVDVSKRAKRDLKGRFYGRMDKKRGVPEIDPDYVKRFLRRRELRKTGGLIIDFMSPSVVSPRDIDIAVIVRVNTRELGDRLDSRRYHKSKTDENIQAEIFGESGIELREICDMQSDISIMEIQNDSGSLRKNIQDIFEKIKFWV